MKIKIDIDTDVIKSSIKEVSKNLWERADAGHIALLGISAILSSYVISDKLDTMFRSNKGTVDVTLEKPDTVYKQNIKVPKTKYSQLYNTGVRLNLSNQEFDCLSKNIYFEAKFEPYIGKIAIGQVTYNRVLSGKWGDTFCSVVNAKNQFSWRLFKRMREEVPKGRHWEAAKYSALMFTKGVRVTNLTSSDHYYARYIKAPKWSKSMTHLGDIGLHKFYASN